MSTETAKIAERALRYSEKWWRDRYEMLERHGYRLRPRYRPGWIPSWIGAGKVPIMCEDGIPSVTSYVIDASRTADGKVVSIKRIRLGSKEPEIARFLSPRDDELATSTNHCVPILDHFTDESVPEYSFLVMPLFRWFDDPPFFSVDEVLDFIRQTLEGLTYIHERGVAHRDCAWKNIMLEPSTMFPHGFHPVLSLSEPLSSKRAKFRRRRDTPGIKYYFIDFGISTRFPENMKEDERLVRGIDGLVREVPELSDFVPYDPFAVDVFILGNVYRRKFLDKYSNLCFLRDLVAAMTDAINQDRPSAAEALEWFTTLVARQPPFRLRWRLKEQDAGIVRRLIKDVNSIAREGAFMTKKVLKHSISLLQEGRYLC